MRKPQKWRVIVMQDANHKVKQFSLNKSFFYGSLIILSTIIVTSLITVKITLQTVESLSSENEDLTVELSSLTEVVQEQDQLITAFERDKRVILQQLDELNELESQLADMISSLNPERIANFDEGPQGGIEYPTNDSQQIELISYQPSGTINLAPVKSDVPSMISRYEHALQELEHVKEELRFVPIFWPADTDRITSEYGERSDPFTNRVAYHNGIDLAGPWGTEIYATAEGVVSFSGRDSGYGLKVMIDHQNSYETLYAHLGRLLVEEGDYVQQGDLIGLMGSTGRSTGVHLHYEISYKGQTIDPYKYMTFLQRVLGE